MLYYEMKTQQKKKTIDRTSSLKTFITIPSPQVIYISMIFSWKKIWLWLKMPVIPSEISFFHTQYNG